MPAGLVQKHTSVVLAPFFGAQRFVGCLCHVHSTATGAEKASAFGLQNAELSGLSGLSRSSKASDKLLCPPNGEYIVFRAQNAELKGWGVV